MKKELYANFIKKLDRQKFFLVKVFANLLLQIAISYNVLLFAEQKDLIRTKAHFIITVVLLLLLIFILPFVKSTFLKFILFSIFSSFIGLIWSYRLDSKKKEELEITKKSFVITGIIFIYMLLFGFFIVFLGIRLPYQLSIVLFLTLLLSIIISILLQIKDNPVYNKIFSGFIIFLFSIYIVYDTNNILNRDYKDDFISASLDYFLDLINIFSNVNNIIDE